MLPSRSASPRQRSPESPARAPRSSARRSSLIPAARAAARTRGSAAAARRRGRTARADTRTRCRRRRRADRRGGASSRVAPGRARCGLRARRRRGSWTRHKPRARSLRLRRASADRLSTVVPRGGLWLDEEHGADEHRDRDRGVAGQRAAGRPGASTRGGDWAVVLQRRRRGGACTSSAVGGTPTGAGGCKIAILGPRSGTAPACPQVAAAARRHRRRSSSPGSGWTATSWW